MISGRRILTSAFVLFAGTFSTLGAAETIVSTGEGIDWFSSKNGATFTYNEGATKMTLLDRGYAWGYLPSSVKLGVGERLILSGTVNFASVTSGEAFRFGLYDCGGNTNPAPGATFSSVAEGTNDMTGFFVNTSPGVSSSQIYSRYLGKEGAGFMTTNQGGDYIAKSALEVKVVPLQAETLYDFSLTLLHTETGYDVFVGNEKVSFLSEKSLKSDTFSVIGLKSPGSGMTLSNLKVATSIPEPSTVVLVLGTLSLLVVGMRRRRSRR